MASAETVMAVYSDRGKRGLPLEGVYRQLYSRDLYLRAYGRIHRNDGAMTPGVTAETVDAMSLEKIDGIIGTLRREAYRWPPARRTYIPKKDGKKRPLGLPTWSSKLVQEALRLLLDAYYEPRFSDRSTIGGTDAEMTPDTRPSSTPLDEQGIEATMRRRHACVSKRKPCLRVTLKTPTSDGFGMSGMRTIGCSDSAAPDTKPRRSNAASASSFARHCG